MKKIAENKRKNYLKTVGAVFLSLGLYGCATVKTETNPFPEGSVRNAAYSICLKGAQDKAIEDKVKNYELIKPSIENMCKCYINKPQTFELIIQYENIKRELAHNPKSIALKNKLADSRRRNIELVESCVKESY